LIGHASPGSQCPGVHKALHLTAVPLPVRLWRGAPWRQLSLVVRRLKDKGIHFKKYNKKIL